MAPSKRRLVVMRHARAESYATEDLGRELTPGGRADAAEAGAWAKAHDLRPDVALVSAASRTQQTWEELAAAVDADCEVRIEAALYTAGPEAALEILRSLGDDVELALFLGHNPTAGYLVQLLNDGEGDPDALLTIGAGYPTATLTVLSFDGSWSDLAVGSARVELAHTGSAGSRGRPG